MPSVSRAQQEATAIALHNPSKLYARNRALAKMPAATLREFASTKGLKRQHVKKRKAR